MRKVRSQRHVERQIEAHRNFDAVSIFHRWWLADVGGLSLQAPQVLKMQNSAPPAAETNILFPNARRHDSGLPTASFDKNYHAYIRRLYRATRRGMRAFEK